MHGVRSAVRAGARAQGLLVCREPLMTPALASPALAPSTMHPLALGSPAVCLPTMRPPALRPSTVSSKDLYPPNLARAPPPFWHARRPRNFSAQGLLLWLPGAPGDCRESVFSSGLRSWRWGAVVPTAPGSSRGVP